MRFPAVGSTLALCLLSALGPTAASASDFPGSRIADEARYTAYLERLAADGLRLFVECRMDAAPLDCEAIAQAFFQAHGGLYRRVLRREEADLHLRLTDRAHVGQVHDILFAWNSRNEIDAEDLPPTPFRIDFRTTPANVAVNDVVTQMAAQAAYYLRVVSATTEGNTTTVVYESAAGTAENPAYTGPLYLDLTLSGNGSKNPTNSNFSGVGGIDAVYSRDRFKAAGYLTVQHTKSSTATEEGRIAGNNTATHALLRGVYSFHKRWSVSVYGYYQRDRGNNIERMRDLTAGLEWILVPFRKSELTEAYLRAGGGSMAVELGQANELGWSRRTYAFVFAYGFVKIPLHSNKLALSLKGNVYAYPEFKGYHRFSAASTMSYQVTPQVRLQGTYGLQYRKRSLTYPGNPDFSNPLQTMFLTTVPGLATDFSVGVGITLGNTKRRQEDRRWAD